jgi:trk system potassium uptake protein TrkH
MKWLPQKPVVLPRDRAKGLSPVRLIAIYFIAAIVMGGFLLSLPFSHASGHYVSLLEAFFTSTSAICVTGLTVVDTGTTYSLIGQIIIMLLIQAGGLGIITLGTLLAFASGRKVGFRERMNLQAQLNTFQVGGVVKLIRRIAYLIFGLELIAALFLWLRFAPVEGVWRGGYFALFHSVSAFNNAGFGLYPDSLMRFVADPLVNTVVMLLIILGGLGFIVELNIFEHFQHPTKVRLSLHSKIVLLTTGLLIAVGWLIYLVLEWQHTLSPLPFFQKLLASLFLSITPRTAGFNTLDYGHMHDSSLLFTILLMFIGANPGSTGGGIKTVTFFLLVAGIWSVSRGNSEVTVFNRRISLMLIIKAGVISMLAMLLIGAFLTLLTLTDPDKPFINLAFETVSAFGTVGLSTGITAQMSIAGKIILIVLMYLGRIGPMTFAIALIERQNDSHIRYPEEDVVIG